MVPVDLVRFLRGPAFAGGRLRNGSMRLAGEGQTHALETRIAGGTTASARETTMPGRMCAEPA